MYLSPKSTSVHTKIHNMQDYDGCPNSANVCETDFRGIDKIPLGDPPYAGQPQPLWEFNDDGKEIVQNLNSAPGTVAASIGDLGGPWTP